MRAYKKNNMYYQIKFYEEDNRFYFDWATERGRRKGQFSISAGINIKPEDWETKGICEFLDKIYKFYDKIENRYWDYILKKLDKDVSKAFKREKETRPKLLDKFSNKIKKFLIDNNINYKL